MTYLEPVVARASIESSSCLSNKIQEKKKLLVLDLDETLVHRTISTGLLNKTCDFSFTIGERTCYVLLRPYVREFLERVSDLFDVVIFTAGTKAYADPTIDFLDPHQNLIARRYYNDSVRYHVVDDSVVYRVLDGSYYKDLSIFKIDLAKVILVDDCETNFCMQKDNGIRIKSWYNDPQDEELSTLLPFLERLADADDVRPIIAKGELQRRKIQWLKHIAKQKELGNCQKLHQQEGNTQANLNSAVSIATSS